VGGGGERGDWGEGRRERGWLIEKIAKEEDDIGGGEEEEKRDVLKEEGGTEDVQGGCWGEP